MQITAFFTLLAALLVATVCTDARALRRAALGVSTCTSSTKLSSHDCNVALLALGPGGIAGAIQFLRVNSASASATSGGCKVSVATTDGGNIDISKGRLEHGGVGGFNNLIADCKATPGHIVIQGGSTGGGDTLLTITAA